MGSSYVEWLRKIRSKSMSISSIWCDTLSDLTETNLRSCRKWKLPYIFVSEVSMTFMVNINSSRCGPVVRLSHLLGYAADIISGSLPAKGVRFRSSNWPTSPRQHNRGVVSKYHELETDRSTSPALFTSHFAWLRPPGQTAVTKGVTFRADRTPPASSVFVTPWVAGVWR